MQGHLDAELVSRLATMHGAPHLREEATHATQNALACYAEGVRDANNGNPDGARSWRRDGNNEWRRAEHLRAAARVAR